MGPGGVGLGVGEGDSRREGEGRCRLEVGALSLIGSAELQLKLAPEAVKDKHAMIDEG